MLIMDEYSVTYDISVENIERKIYHTYNNYVLMNNYYQNIDFFPDDPLRNRLTNITQKFKSEIINGHSQKQLSFLYPKVLRTTKNS